jgi:bidirectional [NiFe] hydrogenase diaphorase subunit
MAPKTLRVAPPTEDNRWLVVNATMRRHGYQPHSLIEALHTVQKSFGYIDDESLRFVASSLNLPLSQTFGVVTFYHFFSLKPLGAHTCVICTGTACHIKGSDDLLRRIKAEVGLDDGDTTENNALSLLTARCLGACGLAPAVVVDDVVQPRQTAAALIDRLKEMIDDGH